MSKEQIFDCLLIGIFIAMAIMFFGSGILFIKIQHLEQTLDELKTTIQRLENKEQSDPPRRGWVLKERNSMINNWYEIVEAFSPEKKWKTGGMSVDG